MNFFLKDQIFNGTVFQWKDINLSGFIKIICICVSKMNESLMGLEWHKGE